MSFIPNMRSSARIVHGVGSKSSRIAIVGGITSAFDEMAGTPFQGSSGTVIEQCLHFAGLIRGECYMTNLFKQRSQSKYRYGDPRGPVPEWFDEGKGKFTPAGLEWVRRLRDELDDVEARVIVACGKAASVALTGLQKIGDRRGYVFASEGLKQVRKVIPTQDPGKADRGNFTYRHMIVSDLAKAKANQHTFDFMRPERQLVCDFANVEECLQWLEYIESSDKPLSIDTEVLHYELASIQFSCDPAIGIFIPIADRWTEDEEVLIWRAVQRILAKPTVKVLQNGIFDVHFLATKCGLIVNIGERSELLHDTMVGHSVMYPELPKGLGFLGSLHCGNQEYWKDKADFNNIKGDS